MRQVRLAGETDFAGWREAARELVAARVVPEDVEWLVGDVGSLWPDAATATAPSVPERVQVPSAFLPLCERVVLHRDPQRWALLYRLLWRLRSEPRLLQVHSDADVARARAMEKAVERDIHKMHAYVRLRETRDEQGVVYVAWFVPTHHIVEAAAPFFARRFASMRWSILTPDATALWDGARLRFGPGVDRAAAPESDALEVLWRTYYSSIFNPARLKIATMQAHMPKKYWANLPEAALIPELVKGAAQRTHAMLQAEPAVARRRFPVAPVDAPDATPESLSAARTAAAGCQRCPLWENATHTVWGEGASTARVVVVGEQPGDQEDLAGRPFVGPAGALLERAFATAGIAREDVYLTNAVKHFKFEPRGKRRIHRTPAQRELEACRAWLEHELAIVQPRLVVALGATAVRALTGGNDRIQDVRGRLLPWRGAADLLVTVHPSAILRAPPAAQAVEFGRLVTDLRLAVPFLNAATGADAPQSRRPASAEAVSTPGTKHQSAQIRSSAIER